METKQIQKEGLGINALIEEAEELNKYKKAYNFLLDCWESFEKEQQKTINKELNKIFGKGHIEYISEAEQ
jgi:hypothetical protein